MRESAKQKQIILVCFCLLFVSVLFSQESVQTEKPASGVNESALVIGQPIPGESVSQAKAPSAFWVLFRIVVVLALVCVCIYFVVYFLKKTNRGSAANDPYLKSIAQLPLSANKSVQVVSIGERAFLLGVTDQSISVITELTDRELIDAMNLTEEKRQTIPGVSFASIIKSFTGDTGKTEDTSGLGSSAAERIRKQREKLHDNSSSGSEE